MVHISWTGRNYMERYRMYVHVIISWITSEDCIKFLSHLFVCNSFPLSLVPTWYVVVHLDLCCWCFCSYDAGDPLSKMDITPLEYKFHPTASTSNSTPPDKSQLERCSCLLFEDIERYKLSVVHTWRRARGTKDSSYLLTCVESRKSACRSCYAGKRLFIVIYSSCLTRYLRLWKQLVLGGFKETSWVWIRMYECVCTCVFHKNH